MSSWRLQREIDLETGTAVVEAYRLDGKLHRDPHDGPAIVTRDPSTGFPIWQIYYWHGRVNRMDGPAKQFYGENGELVHEQHFRNGRRHRDPTEGPAWIERLIDGTIQASYWVDGKFLCYGTAGPSDLVRFVNLKVQSDLSSTHDLPTKPFRHRKKSKPGPQV